MGIATTLRTMGHKGPNGSSSPQSAGRSRFSKALPAPPSLPSFEFESQPGLDLDLSSPLSPLPQVPEKQLASHTQETSGLPTPSPLLARVPRVPVAAGLPASPSPSSASFSSVNPPSPKKNASRSDTASGTASSSEKVGEAAGGRAVSANPQDRDSLPAPPLPPKSSPLPLEAMKWLQFPRRRPVGGSAEPPATGQAPAPAPVSVPRPVPAPAPASAPVPATATVPAPLPSMPTQASSVSPALAPPRNAAPSPVGSISSLLSAYSDHNQSTDSGQRPSTTGSESAYSLVSPGLDTQSSSTSLDARSQPSWAVPSSSSLLSSTYYYHTQARSEPAVDQAFSPPPPPLKNTNRTGSRPQTPTSTPAQAVESPTPRKRASPQQQEQLWRRRSIKADKSFTVSNLNLVESHGSTAASTQDSSQSVRPDSSESRSSEPKLSEPIASAPNRAPHAWGPIPGLPGRHVRPQPTNWPFVSHGDDSMGQEASKLKEKLGSGRRPGSREERPVIAPETQPMPNTAPVVSAPAVPPPSASRLPTPEYSSGDLRNPLPHNGVSPISPAPSPYVPEDAKVRSNLAGQESHMIHHARSSPSLASRTSNQAFNAQSPLGMSQYPPQEQYGAETQPRPHTSSSSRGNDELFMSVQHAPREPVPPLPDPQIAQPYRDRWTPSPRNSKPVSETGSVETLRSPPPRQGMSYFPSIEELPLREPDPNAPDTTDNPGAALFPRNWYAPRPADDIPDPLPLQDKHFDCLTQHRYMTANKQKTNPRACRTCRHKDRNAESYICSSCYLNVCSGCSGLLKRFKGDLGAVLQYLEEKIVERGEKARSFE